LPGSHNLLAQALLGLGRPQEAVAALEEQLRSSPQRSRNAWLERDYFVAGRAYQQLTLFAQAKESYQRAIEIQPNYTEAYYGLATVCARLGEANHAKQYMETFKTIKAQGRADHLDRRSRDSDEGWLRRVLAQTHSDAGQIYRGRGRPREAEEHWWKAAILDPENLACRKELATLYAESGRNHEALELCKQLSRMDPRNALCHFNMGVLYARMNQIGLALVELRQAVELEPGNTEYERVYRQVRETK
jgi:tetratricopeptide (TPR) repeat protein